MIEIYIWQFSQNIYLVLHCKLVKLKLERVSDSLIWYWKLQMITSTFMHGTKYFRRTKIYVAWFLKMGNNSELSLLAFADNPLHLFIIFGFGIEFVIATISLRVFLQHRICEGIVCYFLAVAQIFSPVRNTYELLIISAVFEKVYTGMHQLQVQQWIVSPRYDYTLLENDTRSAHNERRWICVFFRAFASKPRCCSEDSLCCFYLMDVVELEVGRSIWCL